MLPVSPYQSLGTMGVVAPPSPSVWKSALPSTSSWWAILPLTYLWMKFFIWLKSFFQNKTHEKNSNEALCPRLQTSRLFKRLPSSELEFQTSLLANDLSVMVPWKVIAVYMTSMQSFQRPLSNITMIKKNSQFNNITIKNHVSHEGIPRHCSHPLTSVYCPAG